LQGPADLTYKIHNVPEVTHVFGIPLCTFLSERRVTSADPYDRLLKAGTVSLTVQLSDPLDSNRDWCDLGCLLELSKSYHDLSLVASDGLEIKAHKFILAGML
jgi:hypothetical protein